MVSNKAVEDSWDSEKLVALLKDGNENAFRVLYSHYHNRLFHVACAMTSDMEESRDVVQEVFLKVYRSINDLKDGAKLYTWLYRITINECHNLRRRWKRRFRFHHRPIGTEESGNSSQLESTGSAPDTIFQEKAFMGELFKALKGLKENERRVFVLKELEGFSYDKIAEILQIKRGTVSSRLCNARKHLRESLAEYVDKEQG